ncbi:MAG: hypothetical protein AAGF67_05435 [Verrucomicrobiota bacterium]
MTKPLLIVLALILGAAFGLPDMRVRVLALAAENGLSDLKLPDFDLPEMKMPDIKLPASIPNPFRSEELGGTVGEARATTGPVENLRETPRAWTFADGSQLDAVILAADARNAQIRVLKTQGVAQVKLDVFAETDRAMIDGWVASHAPKSIAGFPIPLKNHEWPRLWKGEKEIEVERIGDTNRWRSEHFEITNESGINEESLYAIVRVCESVDGALRALPLPLPVNWGRPTEEKRQIIIQRSDAVAEEMNFAGYWDALTGNVHILSDHLVEPDTQWVVFEFDKPEKVQKYDVIVHEVTHQSTAALVYLGVPAWLPEGLAEYLSATQYAPAAYQFTNTHVTLRHHINKSTVGDRIVKDRRLNLVHLEKLMNRSHDEWNEINSRDPAAGELQYNLSLLLMDYFIHRDHKDGHHFRRYIESILSGVSETEARENHLLRGRSYAEIEEEMVELWKPLGFTVQFQNRGMIRNDDFTIDHAAEDLKRTIASQRAMESE